MIYGTRGDETVCFSQPPPAGMEFKKRSYG
jgi:hypothetical protein